MKPSPLVAATITVCALMSACSANTLFPPKATEKVSPTFHFEAWRDASPSNPSGKSDSGITVELGGRIVQAYKNGKGKVIVGEQLPIVKHPAYGPTEDIKRTGVYEFALLNPESLVLRVLRSGNRFISVRTATSRLTGLVTDRTKPE